MVGADVVKGLVSSAVQLDPGPWTLHPTPVKQNPPGQTPALLILSKLVCQSSVVPGSTSVFCINCCLGGEDNETLRDGVRDRSTTVGTRK